MNKSRLRMVALALYVTATGGCSETEPTSAMDSQAEKTFELSVELFRRGDISWVEVTRKAAELGSGAAMVNLGAHLAGSPDCSRRDEGIEWLKKASSRGYILAFKRLAEFSDDEQCGREDDQEVLNWRRQAALGGDIESMRVISQHLTGSGASSDVKEGLFWGFLYLERSGRTDLSLTFFESGFRDKIQNTPVSTVVDAIEMLTRRRNDVGCFPVPFGVCPASKDEILIFADEDGLRRGHLKVRE